MKDRAYIKLSVMFRSNGEGSVDCEAKMSGPSYVMMLSSFLREHPEYVSATKAAIDEAERMRSNKEESIPKKVEDFKGWVLMGKPRRTYHLGEES